MSTWNTTSTNSRFGSTGVGPAIEGSSSTAWRSKQSPSIPFRTSPWSNVPREQRVRPQPVGAKTGNLSEVNNHLTAFSAILGLFSPLVFFLGAAPFEGGGGNSLKEVLAGCVAVALYLALCQFLVARSAHSAGRTRAVWSSSFVAMIAPLPVVFLAIAVDRKSTR